MPPSYCALLAACGGTREPPPDPDAVRDAEISSSLEMARFAFLSGRYDQAVQAYSGSLERAYARDDVAAIAVAGQELAFSYLRDGKPKEAATCRIQDQGGTGAPGPSRTSCPGAGGGHGALPAE